MIQAEVATYLEQYSVEGDSFTREVGLVQCINSFKSEDEIYTAEYHYKGCIVIPVHALANTHYQLSNKKKNFRDPTTNAIIRANS